MCYAQLMEEESISEQNEQEKEKELKSRVDVHAMSTVLDLAYSQYSVQWQKIGNMQTSAGSILTVLSIIISIMLGIISQIEKPKELLQSLGVFKYSFYISFVFAFVYLAISAFFVYGIIKPKGLDILKLPLEIKERISQEIIDTITADSSEIEMCYEVETNMMLKLNEEIANIHKILEISQKRYGLCLLSSFFSLFSCIICLVHITGGIFNNNVFYISVVGILGYLSVLGIIALIIKGAK